MRLDVYYGQNNIRSEHVAGLLRRGALDRGFAVTVRSCEAYVEPAGDAAAFYGLTGKLPKIFRDYLRVEKRVVFLDLGYWQRRDPHDRMAGYYRVSVDAYDPSKYLMALERPGDRWAKMGIGLKPFEPRGGAFLVAGMSEKSSGVWGLRAEEWEIRTIADLRRLSARPVFYRPKPSWNAARPLADASYSPPHESLEKALGRTFAVVTHHSHVALDGLIRGIPCISAEGPAKLVSGSIVDPEAVIWPTEETRARLFGNLAYCQWHSREIEAGAMFDDLTATGLLR